MATVRVEACRQAGRQAGRVGPGKHAYPEGSLCASLSRYLSMGRASWELSNPPSFRDVAFPSSPVGAFPISHRSIDAFIHLLLPPSVHRLWCWFAPASLSFLFFLVWICGVEQGNSAILLQWWYMHNFLCLMSQMGTEMEMNKIG